MNWIFEKLFGPSVPENPYYEVIQDISNLVPWWYLPLIAGCTILFVILLWANRRRHKRGRQTSAEPQNMEDLDAGYTRWFTEVLEILLS